LALERKKSKKEAFGRPEKVNPKEVFPLKSWVPSSQRRSKEGGKPYGKGKVPFPKRAQPRFNLFLPLKSPGRPLKWP